MGTDGDKLFLTAPTNAGPKPEVNGSSEEPLESISFSIKGDSEGVKYYDMASPY